MQTALQQRPGFGGPYQDLGKLYLETQNYERALFYLKKVVEMDPDEPSPHYLLALTYRHLGNSAESQAEMGMFDKLKEAENERRRPSDAMLAAGHEPEKAHSPSPPDPQQGSVAHGVPKR